LLSLHLYASLRADTSIARAAVLHICQMAIPALCQMGDINPSKYSLEKLLLRYPEVLPSGNCA